MIVVVLINDFGDNARLELRGTLVNIKSANLASGVKTIVLTSCSFDECLGAFQQDLCFFNLVRLEPVMSE